MLPKPERLTKSDFVGLRPRMFVRGTFVDVAGISTQESLSRFACVIAKKRIKRAVDRNTVKRKIYHILQKNKPKKSHYIIIYPKINCLTSSYSHIEAEIKKAFDTL